MKKLFLPLVLLLCAASLSGQNKSFNYKDIEEVTFYGVDFTKTKTYDSRETGERFKAAYVAINNLLIHEAHKYNVGRYFKIPCRSYDIDIAKARIEEIDPTEITSMNRRYALTDEEIVGILQQYEFKETDGYGLLIVAELLDKSRSRGIYSVVLFDIATKEVLFMKKAQGGAGGGGLRNFWANSIYKMMQSWSWRY